MNKTRVGERERAEREWFGAPQEGQVPMRAADSANAGFDATAGAAPESARARWMRRGLRVVRDLVICVALIASVPLGLSLSPFRWGGLVSPPMSNLAPRLRWAERSRPFTVTKDPTVDPMQAGVALSALQPSRVSEQFPFRAVPERFVMPWENKRMPAGLFPAASGYGSWNGPNSTKIIQLVPKGLSAPELAYLKMIAGAAVWPAYDLVARAPAVDVIGGRFVLPFPDRSHLFAMPIWRFSSTKELAYASVSRAAYYLAIGNRAEAEAVLKRTIAFGFVFIDNATFSIDAMIGRVIVEIGRAGLQDLYDVTGDPRAADVRAALEPKNPSSVYRPLSTSPDELRALRIHNAADPALPRAERLENLYSLARTVCTNPREMIFGPGADVRDAYARAAKELARFPSERAVLDLALTDPSRPLPATTGTKSITARVIVGTATIASRIFDNPRMEYCTRTIVGLP